MSQVANAHHKTQSAPETAAVEVDQKTRNLLNLVNIVQNVATDKDFLEIEATLTELRLQRKQNQEHAQKIQQLEAKLRETETSSTNERNKLESQHNLNTRQLLRSHREEVGAVDLEKTTLSQQLLTAKVTAKEKEEEATKLHKANTDLNKLIEDAMSKIEETEKKASKCEKETEMLLSKVKDKEQAMQRQKESMSRQGATIEKYSSDNKSLGKDLKTVRAELDKCKTTLAAVQAFATPLQEDDVSKTSTQFDELWKHCISAVHSCFEKDLHEIVLQDPKALDGLRSGSHLKHQVPLALSNSVPAKVGRSVVVLALISRLMVDRIFKPTFLVDEDLELRQELCYLAQNDHPKEAFTRALLHSLGAPEFRDSYIGEVVQEAYGQVKGILDPALADKFRKDLKAIFDRTARLWQDLQSRKSRFEVDFEFPEDRSSLWKTIKLSGSDLNFEEREVKISDFDADAVGVELFPRVFKFGPQGEVPIVPAKVIQMSQMGLMRQEIEQAPKPGIWRRTTASLENRKSVSSRRRDSEQNGGSFLQ